MKTIILACLIVFSLLSISSVDADESNSLGLDSLTLQRVLLRQRRELNGLLVIRAIDSESQKVIDSVDVRRKIGSAKYSRPSGDWLPGWLSPGFHSYKIESKGYTSIIVDSIRVPTDSAAIVTVRMTKGDGTIEAKGSCDSLLCVEIKSLDGAVPDNKIVGTIIDDFGGLPISNVIVFCEETTHAVPTDSLGKFIIKLNLLKSVTLNVWHPLYDSIRFEVSKDYFHTHKKIEIHFQSPRRTENGRALHGFSDSTVLLLVDMMDWSSWAIPPREFMNRIYTYAVLPGEVFGSTPRWAYFECLPFRLVKNFTDKDAWIQFSREFGLMGENRKSRTNLVFVSETATKLGTKTLDAGTTVSLSLQPDYSPRGLIAKTDFNRRRYGFDPAEKKEVDSCDIIKAEVERVHIKNMLAYLEGDFDRFAQAFSNDSENMYNKHIKSLAEYFKNSFEGKLPAEVRDKRIFEIFRLRFTEIYVHSICSDPASESFAKVNKWRKFVLQEGDVYIHWPIALGNLNWGLRSSGVYRNENGSWKIVAIF